MRAGEPDIETLRRIVTELEFFSLARKLEAAPRPEATAPSLAAPAGAPVSAPQAAREPGVTPASEQLELPSPPLPASPVAQVMVLDDPAGIAAVVERLRAAPLVALDAVTSTLQPREGELVGLSLAASPAEVWYLPFSHCHRGAGELALGDAAEQPPLVRNFPPLSSDLARPAPGPSGRSGPAQGRSRHQARLAGASRRRRRAALAWPTTPCWRASSSIPAAARIRSTRSAWSIWAAPCRASGPDGARGRPGFRSPRCPSPRPRPSAATPAPRCSPSTPSSPPRSTACSSPRSCATSRCRWSRSWWTWSGRASRSIRPSSRDSAPSSGPTCGGWRSRSLTPPARPSISTRPASSRRPVREAAVAGAQADQDRPIDRRRRAGPAGRHGARAAPADSRIPRAAEAQEHLRGHPARSG